MQEEFAIGLGEVHRARAAEKVGGAAVSRMAGRRRAPVINASVAHPAALFASAPTVSALSTLPASQVKEGTKEVAHKTGEALSSAATAVGHQVGGC